MKVVRAYYEGLGQRISEGKSLCRDSLRWMRIWKTRPIYIWLKAAGAFKSGKYLESSEYYRKGLRKYSNHPAHFSARFDLAYCFERMGEYEDAINELSYITSERHPFEEAYSSKAMLLNYLGRNSAALESLKIGLSVFPHSIKLITRFIHISLSSGLRHNEIPLLKKDLEKILSDSKQHVLSEEDIVEINTTISHIELVLGDAIVGDKILIQALCSDFPPVEAYLIRGKRLFSLGKQIQAREMFRRAMILSPGNPYPLIMLSESYLISGQSDETAWAIQLAESACRVSKWKNVEAVELLGRAYEKNQEKEKAELFLERIRHMSQAAHFPFRRKGRDLMARTAGNIS
jgi:tetratricopeptide (TPR) repeat protein